MKKLIFALLACAALVGCNKENDLPKEIELTGGTQTSQEVYADETSKNDGIKFKATAPWTASVTETATRAEGSDVEWLQLSAYEGKAGEQTLALTLKVNTTGKDRKAEIKIVCGATIITITVEQKGATEGGEIPQLNYDIYIAGGDGDVGKYWKNGDATAVATGSVIDIAVSENNIYYISGNNLYKNGVIQTINGANGKSRTLNTLLLANNDVYVGGHLEGVELLTAAAYWKNGTLVQLPTATGDKGGFGDVSALYVNDNNIYACGLNSRSENNDGGKLWTNGVASWLLYSPASYSYIDHTNVSDIFVTADGTVHTVGSQYAQDATNSKYVFSAIYWVNGIASCLSETRAPGGSHYYTYANSITIANNDIYIAGNVVNSSWKLVATYWKNKTPVYLTDGSKDAVALDIAVVDSEVYVVGYELNANGKKVAKLWKNGTATTLGGANSVANKIVIVQK